MINIEDEYKEILTLLALFTIYWFISLGLHEMGHFFVAEQLGYDAHVTYPNMLKGTTIVEGAQRGTIDALLMGLAGGYFVSFLFLILNIIIKRLSQDVVIGWFVVMNFIYGTCEGLYFYGVFPEWSMQASFIVSGILLIVMLYKNKDWHLFGPSAKPTK